MASSLFGGVQKPNPVQSAMQAVNMMRHANPEQVMHQMMQGNPQFADPRATVVITCQTVSNTCHTPKRASVTGSCISTSRFSSPVKLSNNKGPLY